MMSKRREGSSRELHRVLADAQRKAIEKGGPVLGSNVRPWAEILNPAFLFQAGAATSQTRMLWAWPAQGTWSVGIGTAADFYGTGPGRIREVKQELVQLLQDALTEGPQGQGMGPVAFGGFRFQEHGSRDERWQYFDDAQLTIPALLFTHTPSANWLTTNVLVKPDTDLPAIESALHATLDGLPTNNESEPFSETEVRSREETSPEVWRAEVEQAMGLIARRRLDKVVLARRLTLEMEKEPRVATMLSRLMEANPSCMVFAMGIGPDTFVGATPERLVSLKEGRMMVDCLAGSAPRGATPAQDEEVGQRLLHSAKDLREHAFVVESVRDALLPSCSNLRWDQTPTLSQLKHIQHLTTTFTGTIESDQHVLDLVERLHPSPAVGGTPTTTAMEVIRRLEGFDRGWYGGPIGWVGPNGDGEFCVAIRSALLHGNQAHLFAGAGIVAGSDPSSEFRETYLKFQPMISALAGAEE